MAENTNISWSDHTWSPWYGCTQVSMGEHGACVGCYARFLSETRQHRVIFGGPGRGEGTRDAKADSGWKEPLKWEREQQEALGSWNYRFSSGRNPGVKPPPPLVFPSMCDPFDNHPDLPPLRRRFFDLIRATPHLTWLLLTKRPGNIMKLFGEDGVPAGGSMDVPGTHRKFWWPKNAAIGCTAVTQEEADRDIPKLLAAKAALNPAFAFVSMEPLLGPVDLTPHLYEACSNAEEMMMDPSTGAYECCSRCDFTGISEEPRDDGLDWVITGGETDQGSHKARPSHSDWFRSLRDQCAAAGVAYHHKQNGEYLLGELETDRIGRPMVRGPWGVICDSRKPPPEDPAWSGFAKIGKKAAGRLLDGVEHNARPEVNHGR